MAKKHETVNKEAEDWRPTLGRGKEDQGSQEYSKIPGWQADNGRPGTVASAGGSSWEPPLAVPDIGWKRNTPCWYFDRGWCRYGNDCKLSHGSPGRGEGHTWKKKPEEGEGAENEQGTAAGGESAGVGHVDPSPPSLDRWPKKDTVCTRFGRGLCKYGSACPLTHGGRWRPVGESSHPEQTPQVDRRPASWTWRS